MTSTEYILAIDLGTGGPKVALVNTAGTVVGCEVERNDIILCPGGGVEQDPETWWTAIRTAALRLLGKYPQARDHVIAVSCTTQWMGTVPVGADGRHISNAVIWLDTRGGRHSARVTHGPIRIAGYGVNKLRKWLRLTGGIPSHTGKDSLGHILFLKNERPDVYQAAYKFVEPMDYLNFRLTGRCHASFDTITGHWLTDTRDLLNVRYSDELIALAGITRDKLPDLLPTGSIVGTIRPEVAREFGLRDDVQVVTGTPDNESAAVGSGAVRDFEAHMYVGTSSWVTCHLPFKKTDILNNMTTLPSGIPGKYIIACEQELAGGCLTFLRDNWLFAADALSTGPAPDDFFERLNTAAATVPPGSGKLMFLPWLNGERTPVEDHHLRGGFVNISMATTRAQMVRAVLEGVALNTRWMHRAVERFAGRRFEAINFIGGGATSALWCQIMADVLDRPIRQLRQPRFANARGAAFLALAALGRLRIDEIPAKVEVDAIFTPNAANRAIYDELFGEFVQLYKRNRKMFTRLNAHP